MDVHLTPSELTILEIIASGQKRKVMAVKLNVCEDTIKFHLNRAKAKLGAINTIHAVAISLTRGYITLP